MCVSGGAWGKRQTETSSILPSVLPELPRQGTRMFLEGREGPGKLSEKQTFSLDPLMHHCHYPQEADVQTWVTEDTALTRREGVPSGPGPRVEAEADSQQGPLCSPGLLGWHLVSPAVPVGGPSMPGSGAGRHRLGFEAATAGGWPEASLAPTPTAKPGPHPRVGWGLLLEPACVPLPSPSTGSSLPLPRVVSLNAHLLPPPLV